MSRGHLVESTTSRQMAWKSQAHNKPFTKHEPYNICHMIYAIYMPYITEQLHFRPKSTIIAISDQQSHRSASLKLLRDSSRPHLNVYCDIYHCDIFRAQSISHSSSLVRTSQYSMPEASPQAEPPMSFQTTNTFIPMVNG